MNDIFCPAIKEKKRFDQFLDDFVAQGLEHGMRLVLNDVDAIMKRYGYSVTYNFQSLPPEIAPTKARPPYSINNFAAVPRNGGKVSRSY